MKTRDGLVKILAFHVANKRYSFTDNLANALNAEAIRVALYDAIRDYLSLCLSDEEESTKSDEESMKSDREEKGKEGEKEKKKCCPQVEDVKNFHADVRRVIEEKPLLELLKMSREIAVEALALSIDMCKERDMSGKQQEQQGTGR